MSLSYVGDRLQELAQGWLVATLTNLRLEASLPAVSFAQHSERR